MEISTNTESQSTSLLGKKNTEEDVVKEKDNTFQEMLRNNEDKKESEEIKIERTTEQLVADILSLMQTGMTVDERERLKELLIELKEKIKEGDYSEEEIEKMLSNVEKEILALQKRISGQVIKEADSSNDIAGESKETDPLGFFERIESAMKSLEDLNTGKAKKEIAGTSANESELLEMIKEFQK